MGLADLPLILGTHSWPICPDMRTRIRFFVCQQLKSSHFTNPRLAICAPYISRLQLPSPISIRSHITRCAGFHCCSREGSKFFTAWKASHAIAFRNRLCLRGQTAVGRKKRSAKIKATRSPTHNLERGKLFLIQVLTHTHNSTMLSH